MTTFNFEELPKGAVVAGEYIRRGIWVRPGELHLMKRKLAEHLKKIEKAEMVILGPLDFDVYPKGHIMIPKEDAAPPAQAQVVYLAVSAVVAAGAPVKEGTIGLDDAWRDLDQEGKDRLMNVVRAAFKKKWPGMSPPSERNIEITAARIYNDHQAEIRAKELIVKLKEEMPS